MTKAKEREKARVLRQSGLSLNEICERVDAAKSTISVWVRDIHLTDDQFARLGSKIDREKYSRTMRLKREARHAALRRIADQEYEALVQQPDFLFGLALYVGEGTKAVPGKVALTNCDPRVLRKTIRFFQIIGIPTSRIRCSVQLHPGIDEEPVLAYWRASLGLCTEQFLPVYRKVSKASTDRTGHKQPYGIGEVYTCSAVVWHKLLRWMALALQDEIGDLH